MPEAQIKKMLEAQLKKRFASAGAEGFALDVTFVAAPGVTILFGASGSGKSTTLHAIAGLLRPDEGSVAVGGQIFFDAGRHIDVPSRKRGIGYVFQNLALFPHLSVRENIEFGMKHVARAERRALALAMAGAFHIEHTVARYPRDISGGEAQRVALARALASEPNLLLLDEPLSALDEEIKAGIIRDLKSINKKLRLPILYVTHNREEAISLGERVLIYERGHIIAAGEPLTVFRTPVTKTVARLTQVENLFTGVVVEKDQAGGTLTVELEDGASRCRVDVPFAAHSPGDPVQVAVPSGDILLATEALRLISARNIFRGRVESIEEQNARTLIRVSAALSWQVSVTRRAVQELDLAPGREVWLAFKTHSCYMLDGQP